MAAVAVVISCFRNARFLAHAIESVQASTCTDWRIVVVDDGSPDNAAEIVTTYAAEDPRITLVRQPNRGVCAARNAGVRATSPDTCFVLFLDADDAIDREMLAEMAAELHAHPEVNVAYCRTRVVDEDGLAIPDPMTEAPELVLEATRYVPRGPVYRALRDDEQQTPFASIFAWWPGTYTNATLVRRSACIARGGWNEEYKQGSEDWEFYGRLALPTGARFVPKVLASYRRHGGQHSAIAPTRDQQGARLFRHWLARTDLSPEERWGVRRAWRFRNRNLVFWHRARWTWQALLRGAPKEAGREALFAAWALVRP